MKINAAFIVLLLSCFGWYIQLNAQDLDSLIQARLPFVLQQLQKSTGEIGSVTKHPEKTTDAGKWTLTDRGGWTSGFFAGTLWYAYALTENELWRDYAAGWSADLESQKYNDGDHDVGFRMMSSWGNWYKLTGRPENMDVLLTTAHSLASRFNATIGCLRSWGDKNSTSDFLVIVDNMMNLELLFWAAKNGGDHSLYDVAFSHAEKTRLNHVRDDGSTFHVIDYNFNGTVKRKYTHQGYQDWSTWSRGQAWGIYGFVVAYRETGNEQFLQTARKMADYFIDHLPADFVPYCDFASPQIPNESRDASAAAITASALFELAGFVENPKYRTAALNILTSLLSNYMAEGTPLSSILQKGCVRFGSHEQGLIYADYYLLEAICRYLEIELKPINPNEPEERLFSDIPHFGDANTYSRYTDSRWSVGFDEGENRYYINTSDYTNQDGERLGEYTLVRDSLYADFTLTFKAKSPEDFNSNAWVDLAVVFGYLNNENYNYAMLNSNSAENGNTVFVVRNGVRRAVAWAPKAGLVDNAYHNYEFVKKGDRIEFKIDGLAFYNFADVNLGQQGQVGLGAYNDAVFFDDILVTRDVGTRINEMRTRPTEFTLMQNYPNPFNSCTTIRVNLPAEEHVTLAIFDATGRHIITLAKGYFPAGESSLVWDGKNTFGHVVQSGVYFISLESSNHHNVTRKMLFVK